MGMAQRRRRTFDQSNRAQKREGKKIRMLLSFILLPLFPEQHKYSHKKAEGRGKLVSIHTSELY